MHYCFGIAGNVHYEESYGLAHAGKSQNGKTSPVLEHENDVVLQVFIRYVRWSFMRKNVKVFTEVAFQKHLRNFRTCILPVFSEADTHKVL